MNSARTDYSRCIIWSEVKGDAAAKMQAQICRYVGGLHKPRATGVTKKQILHWFYATPPEFIETAITELLLRKELLRVKNVFVLGPLNMVNVAENAAAYVLPKLVWKKTTSYEYCAGTYGVHSSKVRNVPVWYARGPNGSLGHFDSPEAAKEACEAENDGVHKKVIE